MFVFFFKQKTAYDLRISDWSSDVCSSDLIWIDPITAVSCRAKTGPLPRTSSLIRPHHQPGGRSWPKDGPEPDHRDVAPPYSRWPGSWWRRRENGRAHV